MPLKMPYQEKHQSLMSTEMNDCTVRMAYDWSRLSSKLQCKLTVCDSEAKRR